jgi:peptide/nickel transport system permease protein
MIPAGTAWRRDRRVGVALIVIAVLVALSVFAPLITPYDPAAQPDIVHGGLAAPSLGHPFGTDAFSRDLFARVLYGGRISLAIAAFSVLLSAAVGTAVGLAAGLGGPVADAVLMRIVDAALAIPRIFLLLVVLGLWGGVGVTGLVLILGLTTWFDTSRLVRAETGSVRAREYVTASRASGATPVRIALHHVLPNVAAPVIVSASLGVGQIVLIEAGLSFLGVGVRPPTPSWGAMIADGQQWLASAWWVAAFPGMAIVITVLAFSTLGDALRDALDPKAG